MLTASFKTLGRLAGQARSTAVEGVAALEQLGLVQRIRRRVRVAWTAGATASRQIANAYRMLVPNTETAAAPAGETALQILPVCGATVATVRAAQDALAERRRLIEVRLLTRRAAHG